MPADARRLRGSIPPAYNRRGPCKKEQDTGVSKGRTNHYEALFLVSQAVAHNLGEAVEEIEGVLARGESNIIAFSKWDERRLAYEINKSKRGVYFLVYFSCDPVHMDTIERACNLSEKVMRVMFTRADHLTEDEMRATDARGQLRDEAVLRRKEAEEALAKEQEAAAAAPAEVASPTEDQASEPVSEPSEESPAPADA